MSHGLRKAKALLPYFGGKQKVAAWVASRFSSVDTWIEPFGGGLSTVLTAIKRHRPSKVIIAESRPQLRAFYWAVMDDPADAAAKWRLYHARGISWLTAAGKLDDIECPILWAFRLYVTWSRVDHGPPLVGYYDAAASHHRVFQWVSLLLRRTDLVVLDSFREALDHDGVVYADPPYLAVDSYGQSNKWSAEKDTALASLLASRSSSVLCSTYSRHLYEGPEWELLVPPTVINASSSGRTRARKTLADSGEVWVWRTSDS